MALKQESYEVEDDWAIIHQYLIDLNLNGKEEQEKSNNIKTQENQVETSNSVMLILSDTFCTLDPSFLSPSTFLIHTPKQKPTSWNVAVDCSVYTQLFWEVSLCETPNYWQLYLAALL